MIENVKTCDRICSMIFCIFHHSYVLCRSTYIRKCFIGTDIRLWHAKTGKLLGDVDTNQLKNTMATLSPNGRFIAAAAFTADVKVTNSGICILENFLLSRFGYKFISHFRVEN